MSKYIPPRVSVLFPAVVFLYLVPGHTGGQTDDPKSTLQKYAAALQIINFAYVDEVNEPDLVEKAIIATLRELDPHSQYIPREELLRTNEPLEGLYEGIGITFQIFRDTILVISPIPGGPSERLGIMPGDRIIRIEGEDATGEHVDNEFVFERLRGKKGSRVHVSILRKGKKNLIDYIIIRDKIPINSLDAGYMTTPEIGYIRLNRFSRTTVDEFRVAVRELKHEGMSSLILDLRGNSGGYLDVAVDLADEFLEAGKLVVYTEGQSSPKRNYTATPGGVYETGRLVVLIDEGSASASEIVSGAIQDWDRGLIIGRRSFGKGLVQRPYLLPDSSQIRLTIARYYTPSGRCIQKPYGEGYDHYFEEIYNRTGDGNPADNDTIRFPDSLKYFTSHERIVYGGGGIMPDIYVAHDTSVYNDFYYELFGKAIFNDFIIQKIERYRQVWDKQYPSFEKYDELFATGNDMTLELADWAVQSGIEISQEQFLRAEQLIGQTIKALIARNLFDPEAYYRVMNRIDPCYLRAVEVLLDNSYFAEIRVH
ncbi:MAG: S41 family peptidase [Bacteroidales bacterium]|nr:S41 family peptidase [Bacteroidales bacterium]